MCRMSLDNSDYLIGKQLKPEARKEVLKFFKDMNLKPTSMMDLSDGLADALRALQLSPVVSDG